jgi:hypothetical protein
MQGFSVLKNVFEFLLSTQLVKEVFHSVIIIEQGEKRFPAFPKGEDKFEYVGCSSNRVMTAYLRQSDDLKVNSVVKISSLLNSYNVTVPHRLVFFNAREKRNHDDLLKKFLQVAFLPGVTLNRAIIDKEKLLEQEMSQGDFSFGESDFYCAIDFEVKFVIQKNNCDLEIGCFQICNPFK